MKWGRFLKHMFSGIALIIWALTGALADNDPEVRFVPQLDVSLMLPVAISFHPQREDLLLIVNDNGRIDVIDISELEKPFKVSEIYAAATDAKFRPHAKTVQIASVGMDGKVRLWGLDGLPIPGFETTIAHASQQYKMMSRPQLAIAFSPDGELIASGGPAGVIHLFRLDGSLAADPIVAHKTRNSGLSGHGSGVTALAFSPDGDRLTSGGADGTIRLWRRDGSAIGDPITDQKYGVLAIVYSPDGTQFAAGGNDGLLRVYHRDGTPAISPFIAHKHGISDLAVSHQDNLIISKALVESTTRLWTWDGRPADPSVLAGNILGGFLGAVAASPQIDRIALGPVEGNIGLWNSAGEQISSFKESRWFLFGSFAMSRTGHRMASAGSWAGVRIWTEEGVPTERLKLDGDFFEGGRVAISPDGDRIIALDRNPDGQEWNGDRTPAGIPFKNTEHRPKRMAFSPPGDLIATIDDHGDMHLWRADGTLSDVKFDFPFGLVFSVAFSPKGDAIATGGWYTRDIKPLIHVWNLDGTLAARPFAGPKYTPISISYSPDGERIISAGVDGTVRQWDLDGTETAAPIISAGLAREMGLVGASTIWLRSRHRVWFAQLTGTEEGLKYRGEYRLKEKGLIAITPKGVWAASEELYEQIWAIGSDGKRVTEEGAVPRLGSLAEAQTILFGESN